MRDTQNYPHRYHRNGFVAIHALGHMMCGCQVVKCTSCYKAIVHKYSDNYINVYT